MKLEPLTNYELEFIRWQVWEPLRRNQDYKNEYFKLLKNDKFLDPDAVDAFCEKWKLPYHIHPDTNFSELKQQARKPIVVNPFREYYKSLFDHAAFVDSLNWIVKGKYLKVCVDLESSRNQIKKAIKKVLDEWLLKCKDFYFSKCST